MIIVMDQHLANYHPGWISILQMIISLGRPLANDYPDPPASCKWSFGWTGLLQMIIQIGRPLANDHPDRPAFCKWSSFSFSANLLQIPLSSAVNLLHCNNIFLVSKYISSFSFPLLLSSEKVYFSSPNIISLFHLRIISPQQKKNYFSKYHPPFPSLFNFSSKDPKLKILER